LAERFRWISSKTKKTKDLILVTPLARRMLFEHSKQGGIRMDMFVMGLCFTCIGLAVTAMAFVAATHPQTAPPPAAQPELAAVKAAPAHFFGDSVQATRSIPVQVPVQVPVALLLQQIEHHVRLEQAAAESFVAYPTESLLHSKTTSPLVN
jgi:hypothetical protein